MPNKSFELFGWSISRTKPMQTPSPVTPPITGASVVTAPTAAYGYYGYSYDLDGLISNQHQLINRYREIATYPDCDTAIEQIVNEAVIVDQSKPPVSLNVDNVKLSKGLKKKILAEFDNILRLTNFNENCHAIFKRWYIDGRSYFYVVIDEKHPTQGILDVKYIDNLKIREVQKITKENRDGIEVVTNVERYYIFNDNGLQNSTSCFKLSPDTIVDVKSGLVDANSGEVISFLFKAIKPVNQLRMMEDAMVIYRISRAPERRIFYVDVANLQPARAEQYVQDMMNKFRNKLVYDPVTGEIKNNRNYLSMMEDFWLPRREGGRSTEVQTLPGGNNMTSEDVEWFQKKLYQSMNVPIQRLLPENGFSLGRSNEITREEILFSKFVQRLRNNFNTFFFQLLKLQLVAKRIIRADEWDDLRSQLFVEYQHDNYFEELKRNEIFRDRMELAQQADGYKGVYFSKEYIAKNILQFTEAEWEKMKQEMASEADEENGDNGDNFGDDGEDNDSDNQGNNDTNDSNNNNNDNNNDNSNNSHSPDTSDRQVDEPEEEEVDVLAELEE